MVTLLRDRLKKLLIDWLTVMLLVSFIIWFAIKQPIFMFNLDPHPPVVDKSRLKRHVAELVTKYIPRTIEYGFLKSTAQYIHKEFQSVGPSRYQNFTTLAGRYSNVILELGPDTTEILVIGAHFDAANDSLDEEGNASGVSTLLELAHLLAEKPNHIPIKIHLVAYSLSQSEHIESMGSYIHVKSLIKSGYKVKLMLSLDSVGSFSNRNGSQKYPYRFMSLIYPSKGDYISLVSRLQDYSQLRSLKKSFNRGSELSLQSFNFPEYLDKLGSSDHRNFWREGIPAMLVTDTSAYRNNDKHKDPIDRLDYDKMSMLVQGLFKIVMDMKAENKMRFVQKE